MISFQDLNGVSQQVRSKEMIYKSTPVCRHSRSSSEPSIGMEILHGSSVSLPSATASRSEGSMNANADGASRSSRLCDSSFFRGVGEEEWESTSPALWVDSASSNPREAILVLCAVFSVSAAACSSLLERSATAPISMGGDDDAGCCCCCCCSASSSDFLYWEPGSSSHVGSSTTTDTDWSRILSAPSASNATTTRSALHVRPLLGIDGDNWNFRCARLEWFRNLRAKSIATGG